MNKTQGLLCSTHENNEETIMAKAGTKASTKKTVARHETRGFGVPASIDPHHFKVIIPKANSGKVRIREHLGLQAHSDEFSVIERVIIDRPRWTEIRTEVQRIFNARLKSRNIQTSAWIVGENCVDRLFGKELCVLAWAIEGMLMENIPVALRNWLALRPEERWWLFGMTAMNTGRIGDGEQGWRMALRHALGDVAQSSQLQPQGRKIVRNQIQQPSKPDLDLFGDKN